MKTKFLLLIVLLLQTALALAIKVEGTVLDEMKQPVIGATVQVKGAASGTITDLNGKFTLKVDRVKEDILVVSYVGYKTKHVALKGRSILTIELEPEVTELNEVIVVGYGSMRKSDLTGSVTSVKAALKKLPVPLHSTKCFREKLLV